MPKTKKKLFALFVAIDEYQLSVEVVPKCQFGPLDGCVNDAQDMLNYLDTEEDFVLKPKVLKNEEATKEAVINAFETHLGQAQAGDVVLFYYSGHGIQEHADVDVWLEETDKRLECLVCYNEENKPCLLADKELRYLLGRVAKGTKVSPKKESPHILTIFDCCHSGENTRNGYMTNPEIKERQIKCIAPTRDWSDFIFNKKIEKDAFKNQPLSDALPEAIHLHLSACESDESALEVGGHGVFTTHLLKVLKRSGGDISYFDLMSQVKHYMKHSFEQKPQLLSSGEDSTGIHNTFLGKPNSAKPLYGNVIYNEGKKCWVFDMGALLGVTLKMRKIEIIDNQTKNTFIGKIRQIQLDETILIFRGDKNQPDKEKSYRATAKGLMTKKIKIFINNHDGSIKQLTLLLDEILAHNQYLNLEETESMADYTLQIRNCSYYITLPFNVFRPITRPLQYTLSASIENLMFRFQHISQWNHVRYLQNPHTRLFENNPILIEAFLGGQNGKKQDLLQNNLIDLLPTQRTDGKWKGKVAIKITNTTPRKIYVSALYLTLEFRIFLKGIDPNVYTLAPKESVWLFNWKRGEIPFSLDDLVQDYNWEMSEEFLKIIVSTTPFDITKLEKNILPKPITTKTILRSTPKSIPKKVEMIGEDWKTYDITLCHKNPMYNKLSIGHLKEMLALERAEMLPFVRRLYFNQVKNEAGISHLQIKPTIELSSHRYESTNLLSISNELMEQQKEKVKSNFRNVSSFLPDRLAFTTIGDDWLHGINTRNLSVLLMKQFSVYQLPLPLKAAFDNNELSYGGVQKFIISEGLKELSKITLSKHESQISTIITQLKTTLVDIMAQHPNFKFWIHGYDYFVSDVEKYGKLIDEYNTQLAEMTSTIEGVSYIDLRGSLKITQWESDFLPNNDGFEVLAGRFFKHLLA